MHAGSHGRLTWFGGHLILAEGPEEGVPGGLDGGRIKVAAFPASLGQLLQVLAGRLTVCRRHPHRYHVGQVDDHAILVGLAGISRMGQDQAAPFVQRLSDGLKRPG
jgi:hypothetical protein